MLDGFSFTDTLSTSQMVHTAACARINEAMHIIAAATCVLLGQHCEALEAELRVAISADHLVTFFSLRGLAFQILLRNRHRACWTLLGTSLLHPN